MTEVDPILTNSRLAKEIKEGRLRLRGDGLVRYNFSFSIGNRAVGIFWIVSTKPNGIAILRRWDQDCQTWDPISGLFIHTRGRQLHRIAPGDPLFLVEYGPSFSVVVDKIAFKAHSVDYRDTTLPGAKANWRFESAELYDLEFLG